MKKSLLTCLAFFATTSAMDDAQKKEALKQGYQITLAACLKECDKSYQERLKYNHSLHWANQTEDKYIRKDYERCKNGCTGDYNSDIRDLFKNKTQE